MNSIEKAGLVTGVLGLLTLMVMFILGNGDVTAVTRNGEPISSVFPIVAFVIGTLLFVFGHRAGD